MTKLDHLVISCATLAEGQAWVEDRLGVQLQPGGKHVYFSTHNMLLGLGEGLYLEVIACDPDAPDPGRARWFGLDQFSGLPRLTHWACRKTNLVNYLQSYPAAGIPVDLQRGDFRWQMAATADGMLPYDNLFPALLQWHGPHPATRLSGQDCVMRKLTVSHPDIEKLRADLDWGDIDQRVHFTVDAPRLSASFETARGIVTL